MYLRCNVDTGILVSTKSKEIQKVHDNNVK